MICFEKLLNEVLNERINASGDTAGFFQMNKEELVQVSDTRDDAITAEAGYKILLA